MRIYEINNSIDVDYYMTEGCGIFAVALSKVLDTEIFIYGDKDGEIWDDFNYEITHVFVDYNSKCVDAKGIRTIQDMKNDFDVITPITDGPFSRNYFKNTFMGNSDDFPLYGTEADIIEAERIIRANPKKYGLM